jgi:DNA polymerase elongation subunit (family B)
MILLVFASRKLQRRKLMSYVDAIWDREKDIVRVVERDPKAGRTYHDYSAKYMFYYPDPRGKFRSIYGDSLSKVTAKNWKEFIKEQKIHSGHKLFESDINPVFRCLEENYLGKEPPKLNVAFWDIEVDFDPERGYASPEDAFMPITAIAVHLQWLDTLICLAIPPKTLTMEQAKEQVKDFPNTILFETEGEMLETFLDLIQDADVLSGWNSEGFDMPYTVNRIIKTLSKEDTRRLCLFDQFPKKREYEKYGKAAVTYDLIGRVHLDSLELYRKYTYEERHTYRLDAIGEMEIGESKTVYEGTLDQLYNNDFRKFIEYNRQDCALLNKLDKKLKFLDLANTIAHENTVLLQTTMGAVAVTEQAIVNEAHHRGLIVPSRPKRDDADTQAAGAYVAYPKKGLHDWIGSMDINSLYPSVIRALNMGPETIIGQLRQDYTKEEIEAKIAKGNSFAASWEGKFGSNEYELVMAQDRSQDIIVDWENGQTDIMSGAQIYEMIFESGKPWMISANGTIFTHEREGIIPGLLKRWYAERKEMQAKLKDAIKAENKIEEEYWDKRQLVKKINLNSLYGAILNAGCRFFDNRIGQSTTLTGRGIARHMAAKINEVITGDYDHVGKSIIYGDTDSAYFSAYSSLKNEIAKGDIQWDKDTVIKLYDTIAAEVNSTFPQFMLDAHHCPKSRGEVIKAGREIVAIKGLFITKKRYAVLYYDKEGKRTDVDGKPGKIKAMGLDLKRSDTPEFMQKFLEEVLTKVLNGSQEKEILEMITEFRTEFKARPGWEKGSPKRANNITDYQAKEAKAGKTNMPGHVRASINWNTLKRMNGDKYSQQIVDGMKVIVCKVKPNPLGYTSIAYPVDELRLPKWFQELPFDHAEMETTIINNKLENLIGVLEWDLDSTTQTNTFNSLFSFE